jgi:hypothetical protein
MSFKRTKEQNRKYYLRHRIRKHTVPDMVRLDTNTVFISNQLVEDKKTMKYAKCLETEFNFGIQFLNPMLYIK